MGERDRNFEWLNARYLPIQRQYGGQYVAVVNQRIVASGKDAGSVLKKASQYSPQPHLAKIPREDVIVL